MRYIYVILMLISFNCFSASGHITFIGSVTEKPCEIMQMNSNQAKIKCPEFTSTISSLHAIEKLASKTVTLKKSLISAKKVQSTPQSYTVTVEYM